MRLALILVHYHTPELAAEAVAALRADVSDAADAEWLLVDNGSDAAGRALLESLPVQRIDPGTNLGYAGGVNLGVARSTAEMVVVMNPDVLVLPGCIPALVDRLKSGAAVAGPAFYWDRGRRMLLPPAEARGRWEELLRSRPRWRRHARRHWEARAPIASWSLSGSLLAIRRDAWERVGPFDEGFRLFFEETDWLLRAKRLGLRSEYVPGAEAVHLYNRSAANEPRSQQWFEESARRFRRLHYGSGFSWLLERLGEMLPERSSPELPVLKEIPVEAGNWVEVSPNPAGFPAAAERISAPGLWQLPEEIAGRLKGSWIVQVTDGDGRELLRGRI